MDFLGTRQCLPYLARRNGAAVGTTLGEECIENVELCNCFQISCATQRRPS